MRKIPLMNLSRQYESISGELNSAVLNVLSSGKYILGEEVERFEENFANYCGTTYAIGVGNGTDALTIALKACDIVPGDEVITSAMSFFATAEAIAAIGAIPVFVDCKSDTYTMDPEKIEEKITMRTKAIVPVHLYGQCADMEAINNIAYNYNLKVIEDAAQAAGAEYNGRKAGSLSDAGCFSLFPTKNLGCAGDGGIIVTNNEGIYKKCMAYRAHGSGYNGLFVYDENSKEKLTVGCEKYYNFVIGYNSRLDAIQAAILNVKLQYLDEWNRCRANYGKQYSDNIFSRGIIKPKCADKNKHIYYVYVIKSDKRNKLREYLESNGISTGIYFPIPLHLQKAFQNLGYKKGDMPVAEELAYQGLAIPMFAELTEAEREYIIEKINLFKS